MGSFCLSCLWPHFLFRVAGVVSYGAYEKKKHCIFSYDYRQITSVWCTLYQVSGTWYMIPDMYTAAVLVQSKVSIEPPQHRPSARAASARAALSTPSERCDRTQMPRVVGESRESCRLNNSLTATSRSGIYPGTSYRYIAVSYTHLTLPTKA